MWMKSTWNQSLLFLSPDLSRSGTTSYHGFVISHDLIARCCFNLVMKTNIVYIYICIYIYESIPTPHHDIIWASWVSHHRQFDCLLNIFRQTTHEIPKQFSTTVLLWSESTRDWWIPLTKVSHAKSVSISWRHWIFAHLYKIELDTEGHTYTMNHTFFSIQSFLASQIKWISFVYKEILR